MGRMSWWALHSGPHCSAKGSELGPYPGQVFSSPAPLAPSPEETPMSKQGYRVLDSDLHVIEPRDLYERYLDPRYQARAPRPLETRQAYVSNWIVDGYGFPRPIGRGRPDAEVRANAVLKEYAAAGFDSRSQIK